MAIEGKVATILNERELTINQGGDSGVTEGMVFRVVEPPVQIVDPDTKTPLGVLTREKIRVKISEVYPKFSVARTYETYQTYDTGYFNPFTNLVSPRATTKVRTIKASRDRTASGDENVASVAPGDSVVQLGRESNSANGEN